MTASDASSAVIADGSLPVALHLVGFGFLAATILWVIGDAIEIPFSKADTIAFLFISGVDGPGVERLVRGAVAHGVDPDARSRSRASAEAGSRAASSWGRMSVRPTWMRLYTSAFRMIVPSKSPALT